MLCGALNNVGVTANGVDMDVISELLVRETMSQYSLIGAMLNYYFILMSYSGFSAR